MLLNFLLFVAIQLTLGLNIPNFCEQINTFYVQISYMLNILVYQCLGRLTHSSSLLQNVFVRRRESPVKPQHLTIFSFFSETTKIILTFHVVVDIFHPQLFMISDLQNIDYFNICYMYDIIITGFRKKEIMIIDFSFLLNKE